MTSTHGTRVPRRSGGPSRSTCLDLSGADRAEIYQEEKTSVFSEIVSAMEQSVSGLIAYLRAASA